MRTKPNKCVVLRIFVSAYLLLFIPSTEEQFKIGVALTACVGKVIGSRAAAAHYWISSKAKRVNRNLYLRLNHKNGLVTVNVYCPECPPEGGQQKKVLPFGHGRDLAAFNSTGLQNKSFQDRAEISKA